MQAGQRLISVNGDVYGRIVRLQATVYKETGELFTIRSIVGLGLTVLEQEEPRGLAEKLKLEMKRQKGRMGRGIAEAIPE